MHMYVHTQIYTHTIGIYCHIWELGSVFENEEHVNVLPQLQTGKRLGSTGGSHIQHQWILYILWWGMSASALTELCYLHAMEDWNGGPICHVTDIDCLCSHFLQHKGSKSCVLSCDLNKTKKAPHIHTFHLLSSHAKIKRIWQTASQNTLVILIL